MRRRFSYIASLQPAAGIGGAEAESNRPPLAGLKLFGLTYAAGFLFVSLFIA